MALLWSPMRVRELTVNSKFYVVWRVAQLFALTGISKVNDIVYWLWYCSHILCGLFNLNLHWVFVLISRWKNLLKMLVVSTKQVKQQSLITLDLNCVSCFYKLLQFYCGQPQSPLIIRELQHQRRRRQRERLFWNEFAFSQPLSRLFHFPENLRWWQISLALISWGPHSSLEIERKRDRRLFTSSIKRKIRYFHVVVCSDDKKSTKKCDAHAKLLFCLINLLLFWRSRCRR